MVVFFNIESKNYGIALLTGAIEAVAVYFILKKIKIEFSMAQKRSFGGVALGLSGLVMILYSLLGKEDIPNRFFVAMLTGIILCALGVFYLVKRETSINFNSKVSARKIQKIEEKNRFLSETSSELETTLHREKKRLPAYQKALEEIIADCVCDDCKKKAARLLDEIRGAQSEAWLELPKEVRSDKYLPKTSIELFDALITHMFDIAAEKGIDFEFLTSGEIEEITDIITQTQLQTIAADLMQNAVLACGYSENSEKMMITELKKAGGLFELSVKDNGIPFKRETLELLGTCRATTHKEDGGTGIGFMAIFEILRAFSASLIIAENMENKKITVRFDGKGEYILYTNGVEKIKRSVLL
ncbi:MAG: hypothetical protein FWG90_06970 [Oscillospiraceae bacterium]|nr:hypothetical protein [Oscillospiraceae bacterium]